MLGTASIMKEWCSFGDSIKRVAKQVQGALPIVGLLSRLTSPSGGIGKDMLVCSANIHNTISVPKCCESASHAVMPAGAVVGKLVWLVKTDLQHAC